jgi:hypothetical protein
VTLLTNSRLSARLSAGLSARLVLSRALSGQRGGRSGRYTAWWWDRQSGAFCIAAADIHCSVTGANAKSVKLWAQLSQL